MKIIYTNTIPIDVAAEATDAPMFAAILVMFGIMLASNFMPTTPDKYAPNCVSL